MNASWTAECASREPFPSSPPSPDHQSATAFGSRTLRKPVSECSVAGERGDLLGSQAAEKGEQLLVGHPRDRGSTRRERADHLGLTELRRGLRISRPAANDEVLPRLFERNFRHLQSGCHRGKTEHADRGVIGVRLPQLLDRPGIRTQVVVVPVLSRLDRLGFRLDLLDPRRVGDQDCGSSIDMAGDALAAGADFDCCGDERRLVLRFPLAVSDDRRLLAHLIRG